MAYVVKSADPEKDEFDSLLERSTLHRTFRVLAWINRFIHNSRGHEKPSGPLDTEEIEAIKFWWIKQIQKRDTSELHYEEISRQLGLQADERGVAVCAGRIRGSHPIYLPRDAEFTEKLVQRIHCKTLHGGIGLTMAAVRQIYCVPRLRSLVKLVRKKCWGCKRFQQNAFTPPVPGQLPDTRTSLGTAFEVIGVDFAGPMKFRKSNKAEGKVYFCIFACSLSRVIHLELLPNLETSTFIRCFKGFIAS